MTTRLVLLVLLFSVTSKAQYVEQHREETGDQIFLTESIAIPAEEPGYTLVLPEAGKAKGLIVFFNADRDTASKIFRLTIPRNIGVMFVTTGNRLEFFFDDDRMVQIEKYLHFVLFEHKVPERNLMYAGMSLAGTRAVKFSSFSSSSRSEYHLTPLCLAICDAPLDFVRFWVEMNKAKQVKATPVTTNEATWVTGYLERNLKGTPSNRLDAYLAYSPFSHTNTDTASLARFREIRIGTYTEPDVLWWMRTRKKDYYGMNSLDLAAFINELNILGNTEAQLVVTQDKGYLPDGTRHPHSWSIVDEQELVEWFDKAIAEE